MSRNIGERMLSLAEGAFRVCPIPGCGRPPQARAGKGFSLSHCRYHVQARNRYGSFWKRNIPAATLYPYRRAAERFIREHASDFWVSAALQALEGLMSSSGPVQRTVDVLHSLEPRDKARAALARLRKAEIAPERLLVAYLAVSGALLEDPIGPGGEPGEYRRVQSAKAVFRLASGSHIIYGAGPRQRYDRYPRSTGLVLRHLGSMLETACEHVHETHLAAIMQLKTQAGEKQHRSTPRS